MVLAITTWQGHGNQVLWLLSTSPLGKQPSPEVKLEVDWKLEWLAKEARNVIIALEPVGGVRSILCYKLSFVVVVVIDV